MTEEGILEVVEALGANPLFASLDASARALLADHMELVSFPAGAEVIRQGDRERVLYLVVGGRARVRTGAVDLGPVERGEHFGELSLLDGQPRSASVVAETALRVARLDLARYAALTAHDAALGLGFVQALLGGVANRLRGTTDSLRAILGHGAAPRRTRVTVRTAGAARTTRTGTRLAELLPTEVNGHPVVAALVDRRAHSLFAGAATDSSVEPLTTEHWEGRQIYRTSLGLLLLEAAHRLDPALRLQLDHSVGFAQRVHLVGANGHDLTLLAPRLQAQMESLAGQNVPLREETWRVEEARDYFAAVNAAGPLALLRTWRDAMVPIASYGDVLALQMGPLVPRTGILRGFRVVCDQADGLLLIYGRAGTSPNDPGGVDHVLAAGVTDHPERLSVDARDTSRRSRALTGEHQLWLDVLGIGSVGELNLRCVDGEVSEIIRVVEGYHEKRLSRIADAIQERGGVRVVTAAGPSSSGKTTFIKRLKVQLEVVGIIPHEISLDDYYVDRELTPRDEHGDYDYEAFEALRVDLLGEHLTQLLRGERVRTPSYDFKTGESRPGEGHEVALRDGDVLLLEGIHALNPRLLPDVAREQVFRIFICPLAQLPFDDLSRVHASDVRLLRRIVRDRFRRGADAAMNIARWPKVRRGERLHIFPYQAEADAVFDSSLIYEPSVLKVYAERYLLEVPHDHPSYTTAFRLLELLDRYVTIYPDHVPPTSLLREFIGGSGFRY